MAATQKSRKVVDDLDKCFPPVHRDKFIQLLIAYHTAFDHVAQICDNRASFAYLPGAMSCVQQARQVILGRRARPRWMTDAMHDAGARFIAMLDYQTELQAMGVSDWALAKVRHEILSAPVPGSRVHKNLVASL